MFQNMFSPKSRQPAPMRQPLPALNYRSGLAYLHTYEKKAIYRELWQLMNINEMAWTGLLLKLKLP